MGWSAYLHVSTPWMQRYPKLLLNDLQVSVKVSVENLGDGVIGKFQAIDYFAI
jgi:hypothetical protein